MYEEDVLVCQSVWSNNEDDVSLGNKTCDIMVLEKLSEWQGDRQKKTSGDPSRPTWPQDSH